MNHAAALALAALPVTLAAQDQKPARSALEQRILLDDRHHAGLQVGIGLFGLIRANDVESELTIDDRTVVATNDVSGSPGTTLAYDYRLNRVLSIGGAVSHQRLRLDDFRSADESVGPNARLDLNRVLIGTRLLFHYGRSERVEMYSGLRAGVTVWRIGVRGFRGDASIADGAGASVLTPQFTLIPYGVRAYVTEAFTLGGEVALGSPHLLAIQLGYRF